MTVKQIRIGMVTLALGLLVVVGLGVSARRASVQTIPPEQAKQLLDQGDVTLIDLRSLPEFTERHLPNAKRIMHVTMAQRAPELLPDRDAPILLYCRSGSRADQTARLLIGMGYTQVYNLGGGINRWPYATEQGAQGESGETEMPMGPLAGMG